MRVHLRVCVFVRVRVGECVRVRVGVMEIKTFSWAKRRLISPLKFRFYDFGKKVFIKIKCWSSSRLKKDGLNF